LAHVGLMNIYFYNSEFVLSSKSSLPELLLSHEREPCYDANALDPPPRRPRPGAAEGGAAAAEIWWKKAGGAKKFGSGLFGFGALASP